MRISTSSGGSVCFCCGFFRSIKVFSTAGDGVEAGGSLGVVSSSSGFGPRTRFMLSMDWNCENKIRWMVLRPIQFRYSVNDVDVAGV